MWSDSRIRIFNVALAQHEPLIAKNKSQKSLERETIIHFLFELNFGFLLHISSLQLL